MNPFNLIINYFIANSRANYYNVSDSKEILNMGLVAGMISDNPLLSYMLIENKAKELEVISTTATIQPQPQPANPTSPKTPDPISTKLEQLSKKLVDNQKSIDDLNEKILSIEESTQKNKDVSEVINTKISELPKLTKQVLILENKVSELSNTKSAVPLEVKSLPKK